MIFNKLNNSKIKFFCDPECQDVIPEPYPARKLMPDWYKKLPNFTDSPDEKFDFKTLKRCPPFLDAMSTGWIIPLAADVQFNIQDNGAGLTWDSEFYRPMVENHTLSQISTHPNHPMVPIKILNHWIIETPPGWSCLFVPPLNRPDKNLDLMSGIVETDKYFEYINFPGFLKLLNGRITLEAGYPLIQVIPYKRNFSKEAEIKSLNKKNTAKLDLTRKRRLSHTSLYRNKMWERK
jgi:hypothetical protein|tara:strand:- start:13596 stop:14300 length:705 start_codon:yes stop_codon:yes gene_type:complete